jgi:hypothetical protein
METEIQTDITDDGKEFDKITFFKNLKIPTISAYSAFLKEFSIWEEM